MEELVIQRHWEHNESNNTIGVRAEINKKDHIITSVIMILLLSFALCKFRPNGVRISLRAVYVFRFSRCGYFG